MKHIVSFSGGVGSAMSAELVVNKYGKENVIVNNTKHNWR